MVVAVAVVSLSLSLFQSVNIRPSLVILLILKGFDTVMTTYGRIDMQHQRESLKQLEEKVMM